MLVMSDLQTVLREALALSPDERELLMIQLVSADEIEDGYEEAWGEEIERRLIELREGGAELLDWTASERSIFDS